jgi:hypothetical protein
MSANRAPTSRGAVQSTSRYAFEVRCNIERQTYRTTSQHVNRTILQYDHRNTVQYANNNHTSNPCSKDIHPMQQRHRNNEQ